MVLRADSILSDGPSTGDVSVAAIIPARGGSKGIPRKNLAQLGGRPLIAWSIESGLTARRVDRVVVSTDDPEIAEVARECGAEVPFLRPDGLATDETPDLPVFQHALDELEASGELPDIIVHLRPTSPLRSADLIDTGVAMLQEHPEHDSVRSLSAATKNPYKMWRVEDGMLEPLLGNWESELFNQPRQALPTVWMHDGVLDVVWAAVVGSGSMCGQRILPLFTPEGFAIDIDVPDDLRRAEELLGRHRG